MKRFASVLFAVLFLTGAAFAQNPGVLTTGAVTAGNAATFIDRFHIQDGGAFGKPCTSTALSLQYNNAGAFGCITGWTTNGTTALTGGASTTLAIGGEPIGTYSLAVPGATGALFGGVIIKSTGASDGGIEMPADTAIGINAALPGTLSGVGFYSSKIETIAGNVTSVSVTPLQLNLTYETGSGSALFGWLPGSAHGIPQSQDTTLVRLAASHLMLTSQLTPTAGAKFSVSRSTDSLSVARIDYSDFTIDTATVADTAVLGTNRGGTSTWGGNLQFNVLGVNKLDYGVTTASVWTLGGAVATPTTGNNLLGGNTDLGNGSYVFKYTTGEAIGWSGFVYGWNSGGSVSSATTTYDANLSRSGAGILQIGTTAANALGSLKLSNLTLGGYVEGTEIAAPAAPAANGYRIFAQDNGAGKTQLMVIFASGAAQQIAIEP